MKHSDIKLCTSLFSFALEWNSGKYSLEQMMAKVREVKLASGLEIIGFQSLKGFPHLTDDKISEIKGLIEKYGFEPVCLDANVDVAIRRDRLLTNEETAEYIIPQIWMANKLGFPVLRVQMTAKPEAIKKLVPIAEKANVKLGMELHTPYQVDHPAVIALRELYEEVDTPYLGFIPDFGTSMRDIPDALLNSFRSAGVTDELITITKGIWKKDIPAPAKFIELQERASALLFAE